MWEWFFDLDWKIRALIPAILLLVNVALFFSGYISFWLIGTNLLTFLFCGRSNAEKNGYHF